MDRTADQKSYRRQCSGARGRDGITSQVHAVRAGRKRDVEPIVDQDSGARGPDRGEAPLDQAGQVAGLHVALADLHEIDARFGGSRNTPHQIIVASKPATIRDHADDRSHSAPQIDMARVRGPWFFVRGPSCNPKSLVRQGTKDQGQGTDKAPRTMDEGHGDMEATALLFWRRSADGHHRVRNVPRGQKRPDLDEASQQVDQPETRDRASYEGIGEKRLEHWQKLNEVVPF